MEERILHDHYTSNSKPQIISLHTELTSLKMEPNESVTDYVIKTEATSMALKRIAQTKGVGMYTAFNVVRSEI